MESLTLFVALGMIGVAVYISVKTFLFQQDANTATELLGDEDKNRKPSNGILKYARPIYRRYIVPTVQGLKIENYRTKVKRKLVSAGMIDEFTADEFISYKVIMFFALPAFFFVVNKMAEFVEAEPIHFLGAAIFGFFLPDSQVSSAITKRQKHVMRSLPFVVDLLALSTEAGLDFMGAIGKVVEKASPGPLLDELSQVLKEIKIGSSRAEALKEMAVRLNMQEISSFVAILVSADQMGASIGKVLRQQSEMIRALRFTAAESEGAKSVGKMSIITILVIVPIIVFALVAPYIVSGGFNMGGG
jgi:tight adherence protein C